MQYQTRIMGISKIDNSTDILAVDSYARLYRLDHKLNMISSSKATENVASVSVIVTDGVKVFGRDLAGHLIVWNLKSMEIETIIDMADFHSEAVDPDKVSVVPSTCHALKIKGDKVITCNPYGELVSINKNTLSFEKNFQLNNEFFFEGMNFDATERSLMTDTGGNLWVGDIEKGSFNINTSLTKGASHQIVYDKIFDRYWITDDGRCGVVLINNDYSIEELPFTNDDVEWMAFSDDQKLVYIACFDHYLHLFENKESPELVKRIGPFKFQLKQVEYVHSVNCLYVILESGEIYQVSESGDILNSRFGTDCIWDGALKDDLLYLAKESGAISVLKVFENGIDTVFKTHQEIKDLGHGRIRRLCVLDDNKILTIHTDGTVCYLNSSGSTIRKMHTSGILRDIKISPDKSNCVFVNESGEIVVWNFRTNKFIRRQLKEPLWAVEFLDDKNILVAYRSRCLERDSSGDPILKSALLGFQIKEGALVQNAEYPFLGNIKRIKKLDEERVLVNGNGNVYTQIYNLKNSESEKTWEDWQLNTCEDAEIFGDHLYTVTYGYQLNTYKDNMQIVDSQFPFEGYPKKILPLSGKKSNQLIVLGRMGQISLFNLDNPCEPKLKQSIIMNGEKILKFRT